MNTNTMTAEAVGITIPQTAVEQERANGVTRPFPGTKTGLVWDIADAILSFRHSQGFAHVVPLVGEVGAIYATVPDSVPSTCRMHFARWLQFRNLKSSWKARIDAEGSEGDAEKIAKKQAAEAAKLARIEAANEKAKARVVKLEADRIAAIQKAEDAKLKAEKRAADLKAKADEAYNKAKAAAEAALAKAAALAPQAPAPVATVETPVEQPVEEQPQDGNQSRRGRAA